MLTGLFVCAWLILWLAPETSLGRFLHRWMLDRPIAAAERITRGQVLLAILLTLVVSAAVWLLQAEAGPLLGLATPELGMVIASFEVTTWLDALAGALLLASTVRWRSFSLRLGSTFRLRQRRQRKFGAVRRKAAPANDDERHALAA